MRNFIAKEWLIIIIIALVVLIIGACLHYFSAPNETALEEVELEESLIEIENTIIATHKANDFVLNKVPDSEVFLKFHLENGEHHHLTKEEYEKAALEMFYGAVIEEDITYLTTALTPESFQGIWGAEGDFQKREEKLVQYLNELNGNGSLSGMSYKLELDRFDYPTGNGTILLTYEEGSVKDLAFTFVNMGEGHELITQLNLNEFTEIEEAH